MSARKPVKLDVHPSNSTVFVPHSALSPLTVTVDRMGRICLSAEFRKLLGVSKGLHVKLYVSYDKVNKRIGLAKPDIIRLVGVRPYNFDKRGYTNAKRFLTDNEIPFDTAYNYEFDGVEGDGWNAFRLAGYVAPDKPLE
jgi:bifunctional DNA-binding transcriptional regulator/antitoxin component of YhaV-PrlF toxin-antitoxin module